MHGYFVTGTDTNVGKTHVTALLAGRALAAGHKVLAFKPVETGCAVRADRSYVGADQERLAIAAGNWQRDALRGVYRFALPAAPLVAAEHEGGSIDLEHLVQVVRAGAADHEVTWTLVEGAGGWRVPITRSADMSTLAVALGLPVIVVARATLGTINHTLLTIEAIERDGIQLAGVVLSQRPEDDQTAARSNQAQIQRRWSGLVIRLEQETEVLDVLLRRESQTGVPRGT